MLPFRLPETLQADVTQQGCHVSPVVLEALNDAGIIAHNSVHGVPLIATHILQSQQPPAHTMCRM